MVPKSLFFRSAILAAFGFLLAAVPAALASPAASAGSSRVAPRVLGPVDDSARVLLRGNVHPALRTEAAEDQGPVDDSAPVGRMLLLLRRSPEQEAALADFLQGAQTPGAQAFHQWLKPREFGRLYGPADSDLAAVTAWLESHGLAIEQVHAGRLAIEFSGTAGQLREAFQTRIHRYLVHGEARLANAADPAIPAALAPVIAGLAPATDFHPRPQLKVLGAAQFNAKTHQTTPQWTYPSGTSTSYALAPGDFAVQYDINPVYKSGITGAGQSIAIVSASNVDLSLVQAYQTLFGLPANMPQVVVDGIDPGQNDAATEAYLDLELATSVAPGARVFLYTSAGTALTDGLALAAYRAVEDDMAGVISVSYGECELELGQSGNAFWNALWQQAAAQGQTVFVSAGDGGSAGCDNFDAQQAAYGGLQVNGIASTPWNVAVGGTDFYYSQYAAGAATVNAQLAGYWSASTTTPAVSLKQPVPEQTWNDFFGLNLMDGGNPANLATSTMVAGSGGMSSAAVYPSGTALGYPKPAWQSGAGVPADKVRDLPDLSLFAANGYNLSFYPICAYPGDCSSANLNAGGSVVITGVGGTSASAPAMAGIQALVDQSAGAWAGQANYVYYPLAARQPSVFHDVATGNNSVLCYPGTANCIQGKSGTVTGGFSVESGYTAVMGYDLATGLGSLDVANLVKYWNAVTFTPTNTTLSISPTTLVHGKTATITGTVAPSGASGTPTGSITLTGNDGLPHYASIDNLPLAGGSLYATVDNLPGGTYQLTAVYGGDGAFAASKSAPVTVTVTPESNTLVASGWAWNPYDLYLYPLSPGITIPYGARLFLDAQPVSANATVANQATPATGTVTFTDKLGTIATTSTQPLNAAGVAEWSNGVFAPGAHTIGAAYSGDASYSASAMSTPASFTVIPGNTTLTVKPLVSTIAAGSSVSVDVQLATGYLPPYGTLPSGSVTVTLGGTPVSVPWQAFGPKGNASMEAVATFAKVPAGILPVTATYAGDANWLGSSANGGVVIALASKATPTVTLASNSASPAIGQKFNLSATVTGPAGTPIPSGTVVFLSDNQSFSATANLAKGVATLSVPTFALANGTNIFTAVYQGDGNFTQATSNPVNIGSAKTDFLLATQASQVKIAPGGSGTATLVLTPLNGFTGTAAITSSAPTGITATPAAASPSLSAPVTDVVTLNVSASVAPGMYPVNLVATAGGHVHSAQVLVAVAVPAAPVFAPAAGTYTAAQQVTLSVPTPGATIYYTTNGTNPTTSSTRYTGPITVSSTQTLQALAVVSGFSPSVVASAAYTITLATAAPAFSPAAGSYTTVQNVTISDATAGAAIYYTVNGTTPTATSTRYTSPITVASSQTIKAIALATGYTSSPIASAAFTITLTTAAPTFSPAAGTYSTAQSVAISDATAGAAIYYTVNGTTPSTASSRYSGPIAVSSTETIQAIAVATGYINSPAASAAYTIPKAASAPTFSPAAGTYSSAQPVTVSDATAGTIIYYTTNGTIPTSASTRYTAPITVSSSQTIQAIAVATGYSNSAVASAAYTITPSAASPTFSLAGGTYPTAQSVTLSDTTPGATIYYTINGTTPTTASTRYTVAIAVTTSESIQAIAVAAGYSTSPISSATYTIAKAASAPTFVPAAGTYTTAQTVTISDATAGAAIYYTTNGTTPTSTSTRYTTAIKVSSSQTIQAVAVATGYGNSPVAKATYSLATSMNHFLQPTVK